MAQERVVENAILPSPPEIALEETDPTSAAIALPDRPIEPTDSPILISDHTPISDLNSLLEADSNSQDPTASPGMQQVLSVTDLERSTTNPSMSQVTSVSQLSDVQPTDWAYQALQSLVERYGCIAGYPNGTYQGNRFLTRYEFAAGLNACLDRINDLIAQGLTDVASRSDLEAIQRLQDEFATELATLRGRVDALEARTAELEANQFSTTTTLSGLVFFNLTGATADDDVQVEAGSLSGPLEIRPAARNSVTGRPVINRVTEDPEITFSDLLWMNFSTSFDGSDLLFTQFAAGNGVSPANSFASAGLFNTFGVPFTDQTAGTEISGERNDVILRELFYSFPATDNLQVVVGPRINWYRYFDGNAFNFFLTGTSSFNSIGSTLSNTFDRGSGAVVLWDINDQLSFHVGYLGENTEFLPSEFGFNTASNPDEGLFKGSNTITAELTYSPSQDFNVRVMYTRSRIDANVPIFDENGNLTGFGIGGATGEPIYGVADDGFGGTIEAAEADTFGINFDWLITDDVGIFGRYTYGSTDIDPVASNIPSGTINAQALQAGLAFPDLGREGSMLTLSYLIPFSVLDGRRFLVSGGGDGGVQYEFEATYFFPITDHIAIAPAVYVIANPNNFDDNPTIFVGNLRTQFSF